GEQRGDQGPERPEVGRLVTAPEHSGRLLAGPAGAPEDDATAFAVDCVERALGRLPIEPPVLPGRLGAVTAVGESGVGWEVVALAVVGLGALDPRLEAGAGRPAHPD